MCAQRRLRSAWASLLSAWRKLGSLAIHWVHSEDSDQTGRVPGLIWVFAGRHVILLVLSWGGSYYFRPIYTLSSGRASQYWPLLLVMAVVRLPGRGILWCAFKLLQKILKRFKSCMIKAWNGIFKHSRNLWFLSKHAQLKCCSSCWKLI